jgi:hypothetical protein
LFKIHSAMHSDAELPVQSARLRRINCWHRSCYFFSYLSQYFSRTKKIMRQRLCLFF